jgi:hypothetical protein
MPNGKPGDHPLTDLFHHRQHPFPADIDPTLLNQIDQDTFRWEKGEALEEGRAKLKELLAKAVPNPLFGGQWPV